MRLVPASAVALLLLSFAGAALGDQDLIRKAGEWEVTRAHAAGETGAPETRKTCYATDQTLAEAASKGMQDCTKKDIRMVGAVMNIDAICKVDGAQVTVKGTISKTNENSFHTESHMHFDAPPKDTPADISVVTDAKWLGPCKPGETPK